MLEKLLKILTLTLFISDAVSSYSVFMLVGGTGDLAGKYLWDAVFREIYMKRHGDVRILTSGRSDDAKGQSKMRAILNKLRCNDVDDGEDCERNLQQFVEQIEYIQLENDIQFAKFCKNALEQSANITEVMWYLATPPNFYPMVLMSIHSRCRFNDIPLKVALEKPFWKDQSEQGILRRIIHNRFTDNELYLVDHYLAKPTVRVIDEFKKINRDWFKIRDLDHAEFVLLEREQIKDTRLYYYDSYGVVRDVMQSHLNEIMLMILSEPNDESDDDDLDDILAPKREVLARLRPFSRSTWVLGQHESYRVITKGKSKTATFASMQLKFDVAPDSGVTKERPILIVAGKYMDSKRSYARLVFKHKSNGKEEMKEVIFMFTIPAIFVSNDGVEVKTPNDWIIVSIEDESCVKFMPRVYTNLTCEDAVTTISIDPPIANTYRKIIGNFFAGDKSSFTSIALLDESFKVWDHVLRAFDEIEEVKVYSQAHEMLDLVFPSKHIKEKVEL